MILIRMPARRAASAILTQVQMGGVTYMAHIGGFLFGLIANIFFETNRGGDGLKGWTENQ
jgi:membrane associated rhomboid family serine protease